MDGATESGGGLSKLLPKSIAAKRRRKKQEAQDDEAAAATAALLIGVKGEDVTAPAVTPAPLRDDYASHLSNKRDSGSYVHDTDSFGFGKDGSTGFPDYDYNHYREHGHDTRDADEASTEAISIASLEDPDIGDHQFPFQSRPSVVSTHPSQIGYLTTSSPIVQATHLPEPQAQILDEQLSQIASARSTLSSAKRTQSVESSTDSSLRSKRSFTSLVPPKKNTTRSPSPVGRLKGVFTKSKKTPSAATSPDRSLGGDETPDLDRDTRRTRDRGRATASASTSDLTTTTKPFLDNSTAPQPNATSNADASRVKQSTTHSPERRRSRASTNTSRIDTSFVPQTPPNTDKTPVIVNTPPTPTDHNAPYAQSPPPAPAPQPAPEAPATAIASGNTNGGSATGTMLAHRRGRSGSGSLGPSKLSNITLAPLTPTPENGTASNPGTPSGGFFSSVFSAAQNAATSLTSTIQNTGIGPTPPKNKNVAKPPDIKIDEQPEVEPPPPSATGSTMEKEPAVKTMGSGELSLSQLGITDTASSAGTPITAKFPESDARARSESAPTDAAYAAATRDLGVDDGRNAARPQSLYDPGNGGDRTPPQGSIHEDKISGVQRSGSIRSAIGRHRKRGSSAVSGGTATTIGAAIAAANASLAHPQANASVPKLTGFAVASKKRNRDFHGFFKSVPDDDYLIEDYSCALQREILAHGRLYVSEGHLCFSSNILGWSTTLVMSFDEIVSVEKRSTALVFKNGLMISTLHAKHIFASFTSRDSTYDLIVNIWKLGHPTLQSSLNGVQLEGTGGDKTEKVDANSAVVADVDDGSLSGTDEESDSGDDDDVYDEDDDAEDLQDVTQLSEVNAEPEGGKTVSRKVSGAGANGAFADIVKEAVGAATGGNDFPGPAAHAPTDCGDSDTHYDRVVGDDVIPAPLGKVYNLLFGPASVTWMTKWLTVEAKCTELTMEDKKGLTLDNKSRYFTYIKPLNGAIGPKQTKCLVTETLDSLDFEKAINFSVTTQTPDVPNGNIFSVKTKYCLSWADNNSTRVQSNCTIEWTGKSPIEKGANDGQTQYCKDLFASLKTAVSSKPRAGGAGAGSASKGKKKSKKSKAAGSTTDAEDEQVRPRHVPKTDWGPLEPVRGILEPVLDIAKPLLTGNMMYGLLVGLLVATWFGFGLPGRQAPGDMRMYGYPDRLAAYDEMWRREESELWEWLEERVGLERLHEGNLPMRKRAMEPNTVEERVREDRMNEREIEEAIKVTEEKLKVLKGVMDKKKPTSG
ncbi:GRAM domain-containing protein [Colletotrichum orchidophilum]|uniref:GRAM domain-containing protein n=1 Tax=Colletotrichum orchidophilum TaxID=1209926 RepID=A0A1G4AZX9_9PEZI|nr:GRAM domain-containing protein [Colletotrichum orchidophilum]OHE94730.1 GRAM domain-containing protein [Colletotrichum orchidophilum]